MTDRPIWVVDDGDEHIVHHRVTNQRRHADDVPPADLREAARFYDFTRRFMEDALEELGHMDPADLDPVTKLQVGRWWRSTDTYRDLLEKLCEDE